MMRIRRTHWPLARQFITLGYSRHYSRGRSVMVANAGGLQPRLRRRFENLVPKRSIGIDCGHSDLTRGRSVVFSHAHDSKLFLLVQARERNFVAQLEHAVDAIEERTAPADIDGHHSLIQRTAANVHAAEEHR